MRFHIRNYCVVKRDNVFCYFLPKAIFQFREMNISVKVVTNSDNNKEEIKADKACDKEQAEQIKQDEQTMQT